MNRELVYSCFLYNYVQREGSCCSSEMHRASCCVSAYFLWTLTIIRSFYPLRWRSYLSNSEWCFALLLLLQWLQLLRRWSFSSFDQLWWHLDYWSIDLLLMHCGDCWCLICVAMETVSSSSNRLHRRFRICWICVINHASAEAVTRSPIHIDE